MKTKAFTTLFAKELVSCHIFVLICEEKLRFFNYPGIA
jgi:hypothetical protein